MQSVVFVRISSTQVGSGWELYTSIDERNPIDEGRGCGAEGFLNGDGYGNGTDLVELGDGEGDGNTCGYDVSRRTWADLW